MLTQTVPGVCLTDLCILVIICLTREPKASEHLAAGRVIAKNKRLTLPEQGRLFFAFYKSYNKSYNSTKHNYKRE